MLLKSYGEKEKKVEVKKVNSYIIAHMNEELFTPEYSFLQISWRDVNKHFNSNVSSKINEGYNYFVEEFKKKFKTIKSAAFKELTN